MTLPKGKMMIKSILLVCMGNICRSPTAEAIFKVKMAASGIKVFIDSAGTLAYHQGSLPDHRSVIAGNKRGYVFDNMIARQIIEQDFEQFDLILAADENNLADLRTTCPQRYQDKLKLMMAFSSLDDKNVPDPYYGQGDGFEGVINLLEESAEQWIQFLLSE
ncbi:low molecular weight protein-tyrosine-phosphatase [Shewanella surugensis]|uniref:protein-tyrosine-phosphatase n=1 Tax=Shewanella surugensis TaxID=212020 RepID=A0ABT0L9Z4_9GAMM|nr:low molecular weight protein-tyrosine-phosphatase [Shewanella surugensis]MCL1124180.1 low molecular weight phosphotyrosine protein phosphatase [Shewanella surugensis]